MTDAEIEAMIDSMLPEWAVRKSTPGLFEVGNQLPTRDGRRCGNAHIIEAKPDQLGLGRLYYTVLTDAGTKMTLNSSELNELFWPSKYTADVNTVRERFERDEYLHS